MDIRAELTLNFSTMSMNRKASMKKKKGRKCVLSKILKELDESTFFDVGSGGKGGLSSSTLEREEYMY